MRITKKWARSVRDALQARVKELRFMDAEQLRTEHNKLFPTATVRIADDICANCGGPVGKQPASGSDRIVCLGRDGGIRPCMTAERTMAEVDRSQEEMTRKLMMLKIDELIPSSIVD